MTILDLFAGTGSSTQAFADHGHRVIRVEFDAQHRAEFYADIGKISADYLLAACGGVPDFVWASPPCTAFSVASIGTHWGGGRKAYEPKTQRARDSMALVTHTVALIRALGPRYWLMENPRGVLRNLPPVAGLTRWTTTYCQYGDERMKPTDLWGVMPDGWAPRPPCRNGMACHVAAPRGAKTGTQGRKGSVDRSRVPYGLSLDVHDAITGAAR